MKSETTLYSDYIRPLYIRPRIKSGQFSSVVKVMELHLIGKNGLNVNKIR